MSELDRLADKVLAIDSSKSRADVIIDLEHTNSAEVTINRIFDGQFLDGTKARKEEPIVLDLDDDDDDDGNDDGDRDIGIRSNEPSSAQSTRRNSPQMKNDLDDFFGSPVEVADEEIILPSSGASMDREVNVNKKSTIEDDFWELDLEKKLDDDSDEPLDSADDFFDHLLTHRSPSPVVQLDEDEEDEFMTPTLTSENKRRPRSSASSRSRSRLSPDLGLDLDFLDDKPRLSSKEIAKRERKRMQQEAAAEKKRKREELKQQKQIEKERQQMFEKVNRIRGSRTEALKEMIVDIHPDFLETKPGKMLKTILEEREAEVKDLLQLELDPPFTLSWRRKCQAEWDTDSQAFIPLHSIEIVQEPVVLVYLDIPLFVKHVKDKTVDAYIKNIKHKCQDRQIMLLIEGLENYYQKKLLQKRRRFDSVIRNSITETSSRRKNNLDDIEDDPEQSEIEECLNYLQLVHDIMLVPTTDDEDTVSWIESLTTDLALSRYKNRNLNNSFKVGKSGTDPKDTFSKMLQEIQLCTPAIADSVINAYPTLQALHQGYNERDGDGELMLAHLEVENGLNSRDRKVNRVMSRKIYTIFNSEDPEQIIY